MYTSSVLQKYTACMLRRLATRSYEETDNLSRSVRTFCGVEYWPCMPAAVSLSVEDRILEDKISING